MIRDIYPIHGGAIRANRIGSFVMGGETFHVIRPGYCTQGKRRLRWTQVVHEDVPVFESKTPTDQAQVIAKFEKLWAKTIGADRDLLQRALVSVKKERRKKFRDGHSGEAPAPTMRDGRGEGLRYTT